MPENLEQALNVATTVHNALKLEGETKREGIYRSDAREIVCYGCNRKGHKKRDCRISKESYPRRNYYRNAEVGIERTRSRETAIRCWLCNKLGHISRDCTRRNVTTTPRREAGVAKGTGQSPN
jgi:hypothetical protein